MHEWQSAEQGDMVREQEGPEPDDERVVKGAGFSEPPPEKPGPDPDPDTPAR